MAEVKWIKIVTDIFDDEKILLIESMPDADSIIVIWFKLLTLAGKINNGGVLLLNDKLAYTDEMLATIFRRPINTVRLAVRTFEQFEMIEVVNNAITIPNWSKHQSLEQLKQRNEYMKNYMRDYREKQKLLATGKVNSKANVSEADIEGDKEDKDKEDKDKDTKPTAFDLFWAAYPKKIGKAAAKKAFAKVPNSVHPLLVPAVEAHKQSTQWQKDNGQYIPNPSTWLNQGRWEDELPETTAPTVQPNAAPGRSSNDIRKMMDML